MNGEKHEGHLWHPDIDLVLLSEGWNCRFEPPRRCALLRFGQGHPRALTGGFLRLPVVAGDNPGDRQARNRPVVGAWNPRRRCWHGARGRVSLAEPFGSVRTGMFPTRSLWPPDGGRPWRWRSRRLNALGCCWPFPGAGASGLGPRVFWVRPRPASRRVRAARPWERLAVA